MNVNAKLSPSVSMGLAIILRLLYEEMWYLQCDVVILLPRDSSHVREAQVLLCFV